MALTQSHYRFGIDELAESTHGWHAAEDTAPTSGTIPVNTTFLLRITLQADGTAHSNVDCEYQVRKNGGAYQNITTTSTIVKAVAATALTNGGNCTKRLSGTGTFESSGAGQTEDGVSGGTANDIVASGNSECECGLQIVGTDVADGDVLDFRLTRDGGTLIDTYAVTPTYTVDIPSVTCTLSQTLAAITVTSAAAVTTPALATLSRTLAPVTISSAATVTAPGATATLSQTLAAVTLSAAGTVRSEVLATLSLTLAAIVLTASVHVGADAAYTWAWRTGRAALRRFTGYRRRGR